MNKALYRLVFNKKRGMLMVVSEIAKGDGKSSGRRGGTRSASRGLLWLSAPLKRLALVSALLTGAWIPAFEVRAQGLPEGGAVVGGSATITQPQPHALLVNQATDRAVIHWNRFNIDAGHSVQFQQPGASAAVLNRVVGLTGSSQIMGTLTANGQVFLINPQGIVFGRGAMINVGGLIASTKDINAAEFMRGHSTLTLTGTDTHTQLIENNGKLQGGYIVLMSDQVKNHGVVQADQGQLVLAAGDQATVSLANGQLVRFALDKASIDAVIQHQGTLQAENGRVLLTAASANALLDNVINLSGVTNAAGTQGTVIVDGGSSGTVELSGALITTSSPNGRGGNVTVSGEYVSVRDHTLIDARGAGGGGTVLIGGGYQGTDASVRNAKATVLEPNARIDASATQAGDGGTVVLWSDEYTGFYGKVAARGGPLAGDGGLVETSSRGNLQAFGQADAASTLGKAGQWLLDPVNLLITNATDSGYNNNVSGGFSAGANSTATVNNVTIQNALNVGTSVTLNTANSTGRGSGYIVVNADIVSSGPGANLSFYTKSYISQQANITALVGPLNVTMNAAGDISFFKKINLNKGALAANSGAFLTLKNAGTISAASAILSADTALTLDGTLSAATLALSSNNANLSQASTSVLNVAGRLNAQAKKGSVNLAGANNALSGLVSVNTKNNGNANINSSGDLKLADINTGTLTANSGGALNTTGTISAASAILSANITLTLDGTLSATTVVLTSNNADVNQAITGVLNVNGSLNAQANNGSVNLSSYNNALNGSVSLTSANNANINSTGNLTLATVNIGTLVANSGGSLNATGTISAANGVSLTGQNNVRLDGTITSPNLNATATTGSLLLPNPLSVSNNLTLQSNSDLTVSNVSAGNLSASTNGALNTSGNINTSCSANLSANKTLTLDGTLNAANVALTSNHADITQVKTGVLNITGSLNGQAFKGSVNLSGPNNALNGLVTLNTATTGNATINSTGDLKLANISTPTLVATSGGALSTSGLINASNSITLTGLEDVLLAGTLTSPTLVATAKTGVLNTTATIKTTGGTLLVANNGLNLDGTLNAASLVLTSKNVNVTQMDTGVLNITGPLNAQATNGSVNLLGPNNALNGSVSLTSANNADINSIGDLNLYNISTGTLNATSGGALNTTGTINAANSVSLIGQNKVILGGTISSPNLNATSTNGSLALPSILIVPHNLTLTSNGDLALSNITAANLTASTNGALNTSGKINTTGSANLSANQTLTLDGTLNATNLALFSHNADVNQATTGVLNVNGTLNAQAPNGSVNLLGATNVLNGPVSVSTGNAGSTTVNSNGDLDLADIETGTLTASANGKLNTTGVLSIQGNASLEAGSDILLDGSLSAENVLLSSTRGNISQAREGVLHVRGAVTAIAPQGSIDLPDLRPKPSPQPNPAATVSATGAVNLALDQILTYAQIAQRSPPEDGLAFSGLEPGGNSGINFGINSGINASVLKIRDRAFYPSLIKTVAAENAENSFTEGASSLTIEMLSTIVEPAIHLPQHR